MVEPHITVKAQGGLSEDKGWISSVKKAVQGYPNFHISMVDVGNFGENVVFLTPSPTRELSDLHKILMNTIKPGDELTKKYFEGANYHFHLTLAGTSWGMTSQELLLVKEGAKDKLLKLPKFKVSFIRVYEKKISGGKYEKLIDIPFQDKF
jgi:2'-5' RNA ligase